MVSALEDMVEPVANHADSIHWVGRAADLDRGARRPDDSGRGDIAVGVRQHDDGLVARDRFDDCVVRDREV